MGGLRISNEVVLAKAEVTYNTDPTPAASTDAVLIQNVDLKTASLRMVDRAAVRGQLGMLQKIYGGQLRTITFSCEVKGSGAAGTPPEIGPLLTACGLTETIVASTSVAYTPNDGTHKSVTIYYFEGGRNRHILTGCRGSANFKLSAGGLLTIDFTFTGHYGGSSVQTQPTPT
ncbi:MAG: phage tail tube protein, partial [Bradyrhizobium sp.]